MGQSGQYKTWRCPNGCKGSYSIQTNFNNGETSETAHCHVCSSVMSLVIITKDATSYPVTDQQNF